MKLIVGEQAIKKGKLIKTVTIPKEFILSFAVKPTWMRKSYNTVLEIYGVLKVWFRAYSTKGLMVRMYKMSGRRRDFRKSKTYETNKWVNVVISQLNENGVYNFEVVVDGEVLHSTINSQPRAVDNAKFYVADPYFTGSEGFLPGYVKKLSLIVKQ